MPTLHTANRRRRSAVLKADQRRFDRRFQAFRHSLQSVATAARRSAQALDAMAPALERIGAAIPQRT